MPKRKQKRINNILPRILIGLGIFLILLGFITQTQIFFRFLMTQREQPSLYVSQYSPSSLVIPGQEINVKVDEGGIINGEWVLSNTDALYLPTSGKLGEGYNTIIYAHNTPELFGKLVNLSEGEMISVKDKAGKSYEYKVVSVEEVNPSDLKSLYTSQKNVLTLFSCSGWADTKRIIVKARLVSQ